MSHQSKCERCANSVECKVLNDARCHNNYVPSITSPSAVECATISPAGKSTLTKQVLALQV